MRLATNSTILSQPKRAIARPPISGRKLGKMNTVSTSPCDPTKGGTALFNVKYSPNLGDGIIAECLETALSRCEPPLRAFSIDMAGRTEFDPSVGRNRSVILKVIERMPAAMRKAILPLIISAMVRLKLEKSWRRKLSGCDSAIIGGGALLADKDQNFPIKLSTVLNLCSESRVPVAVSHVGFTSGWSPGARSRFAKAFRSADVKRVTMRDRRSMADFEADFPELSTSPQLAVDPGLLCQETYGSDLKSDEIERKRVGICVTHPLVLRLHSSKYFDDGLFIHWLNVTSKQLTEAGLDVVLFTNGSLEDEDFLDKVTGEFRSGGPITGLLTRMNRFSTPGELSRFISTLDCVVSHRLHACIAAYSYRIPSVGLAWDAKLGHFFELVVRSEYLCDWRSISPFELTALVEKALENPPEVEFHTRILNQCRAGIQDLAAAMQPAKSVA